MATWPVRLGLSFIVTLGISTTWVRAQAPLVPPSAPIDTTPNVPLISLLARPQMPPPPAAHPLLNQHGYACDSSLNWYGCGGLRSQWDFVFGSCRTFFGEPCVPRVPHPGFARE